MSQSGQLILHNDADGDDVCFEPTNNTLRIGSDKTANVCLSGLKDIAFDIAIDSFGRVSTIPQIKSLRLNLKFSFYV